MPKNRAELLAEIDALKGQNQALQDINLREQIALRESDARFDAISEMSLTGVSIIQNSHFRYVNSTLAGWLGYSRDELLGMAPLSIVHPDDRALMSGYMRRSQEGAIVASFTARAVRKDGEVIFLEVLGRWIEFDGHPAFFANELDITERSKKEKELQRLNRTMNALTHSDHALMHAADEKNYLDEVCRIIVEDCGHILAWIGFVEQDSGKTIHPIAYAGSGQEYIESLHLSWGNSERGQGPTGIALRTRKPYICADTATDPTYALWRDEALRFGFASLIALPLLDDGKPLGNLTIYSHERNPFSADEVDLLTILANDLVYGMITLRLRTAHAQMEAALRESEARFHSLFDQMTEGFALHEIICDENGQPCDYRFLEINLAFEQLTGLKRKDIIGKCKREVMPDDDLFWIEIYGKVALTGQPIHFEDYSHALKQYYEVFAYSPTPGQFAVLFMNVTERKETEEALALSEEKYRSLYETMTQGVVYQDANGKITSANPAAQKMLGMSLEQMQGRTSYDPLWKSLREDGTDFPGEEHPIVQALKTGKTIKDVIISTYTFKTREYRWMKVDAIPQFHPGRNQPYQAYAIFDDITQRKQLELELERHNNALLRLSQLSRELSPILDRNEILEKSLKTAQELAEVEHCRIWLWDEQEPGWLVCRAAIGPFPEITAIDVKSVDLDRVFNGPVSPEIYESLFHDPTEPSKHLPSIVPGKEVNNMGGNATLIPLQVRGKINGVLEICNHTRKGISHYDQLILDSLAASTAIAIENVRTFDQTQQAAVMAERNRLARDLHDSVSQALFSASMIAEALPRLWDQKSDKVKDGLDQLHLLTRGALADMRSLLYELRPSSLLEIDLCDLLRMLVSATLSRTQAGVELNIADLCSPPQDIKIAFYRIAQEAINNIVKHAGANRITISLHNKENGVELFIHDDGQGFEKKRITQDHMGLEIMRERAEKNGITLTIHSQIQRGTEIAAFWPGEHSQKEGVK